MGFQEGWLSRQGPKDGSRRKEDYGPPGNSLDWLPGENSDRPSPQAQSWIDARAGLDRFLGKLPPVWKPAGSDFKEIYDANQARGQRTNEWLNKPAEQELFGINKIFDSIRRSAGKWDTGIDNFNSTAVDWADTAVNNSVGWWHGKEAEDYAPYGSANAPSQFTPGVRNMENTSYSLSAEEKFLQFMETYDGNQTGMGGDFLRNSSDSGDPSAFMRERQMQGGTAGYDNRGAVSAYYDEMRGRVEGEYNNARGDIGNVYDQAADMMKPMAGQSAAAYTDAINAGAAQSESLIADTQERINADAASRASSFAELGISGDGRLSETSREAERGMSDIGANSSNWGGLMGALSVGQQSRLNQDYVGAGDAKVMAQTDLTSTYQDYLRAISEQESSQMADAYQPGTPGEMGPEFWETLPKSVQEEYWNRELGYKEQERPYSPEFAELEEYMLRTKGATIEEMNFMYDWRANSPANRDPMAMLNPLWNGQVNEYLDRK